MRQKRTTWNFDEHTHRVEIFKSEEGNEIRVDHLQKGNSRCGYVKFVNDSEGLTVFGDFGRWSFCRPFYPSADGGVSDGYWNEKLKMYSSQDHAKYDAEETRKELQEWIDERLEDYGYEGKELKSLKGFYKHLLDYVDDELEYTYYAFRGDWDVNLDYEQIPFCKKGSYQLEIVFDAFDEICRRLTPKRGLICSGCLKEDSTVSRDKFDGLCTYCTVKALYDEDYARNAKNKNEELKHEQNI